MKRKDEKVDTGAAPRLQHNPFGALGALREALPAGDPASALAKPVKPGPARAVVRYERKGRGGKEVTVVEQLSLPAKELDVWLKALKSALGCGGLVEDSSLVLQGDQRKRLPALLEGRGVRKITVS